MNRLISRVMDIDANDHWHTNRLFLIRINPDGDFSAVARTFGAGCSAKTG
jgi:hypothetical protein